MGFPQQHMVGSFLFDRLRGPISMTERVDSVRATTQICGRGGSSMSPDDTAHAVPKVKRSSDRGKYFGNSSEIAALEYGSGIQEGILGIRFLVGVEFDTEADLGMEVTDAISKGKVPKTPLVEPSDRRKNRLERKVQSYLSAHGLPGSYTYQSVFVIDDEVEKPKRIVVEAFGDAFVLKPDLVSELVVASIGEMQNVVDKIPAADEGLNALDHRNVGLHELLDKVTALRGLAQRAAMISAQDHANTVFVEARLNRVLKEKD